MINKGRHVLFGPRTECEWDETAFQYVVLIMCSLVHAWWIHNGGGHTIWGDRHLEMIASVLCHTNTVHFYIHMRVSKYIWWLKIKRHNNDMSMNVFFPLLNTWGIATTAINEHASQQAMRLNEHAHCAGINGMPVNKFVSKTFLLALLSLLLSNTAGMGIGILGIFPACLYINPLRKTKGPLGNVKPAYPMGSHRIPYTRREEISAWAFGGAQCHNLQWQRQKKIISQIQGKKKHDKSYKNMSIQKA